MNSDSQKIITVLEMLSRSLEDESSILRVRKWIKEQTEVLESEVKPNGKEPKQVLMDTRRNLLREVRRIETSL